MTGELVTVSKRRASISHRFKNNFKLFRCILLFTDVTVPVIQTRYKRMKLHDYCVIYERRTQVDTIRF